jgi:hypothetical protein
LQLCAFTAARYSARIPSDLCIGSSSNPFVQLHGSDAGLRAAAFGISAVSRQSRGSRSSGSTIDVNTSLALSELFIAAGSFLSNQSNSSSVSATSTSFSIALRSFISALRL